MKEKNNLIFDCLILIIALEKPSKKRAEKYLFGNEGMRGPRVGRPVMERWGCRLTASGLSGK